jgi:predicted RNase H-like HicB family nuclease
MPVPRYHINLFWSEEDDAWIADVPDLGSVSAHGESAMDALREVEVAIEAAVAVLRETGGPVPEPRYRPAIYATGHRRDAA